MRPATRLPLLLAPVLLAACVSLPEGPSVMVLPGSGKTFDQFRTDDLVCRDYAFNSIGGKAGERYTSAGVTSAAVGTVVGAAAGAAIDGGRGAGIGAGTGLLIGSAAGAGSAQTSGYGAQRRYDNAYVQCMYAYGHRVPVSGSYSSDAPRSSPSYSPPPPPPPR